MAHKNIITLIPSITKDLGIKGCPKHNEKNVCIDTQCYILEWNQNERVQCLLPTKWDQNEVCSVNRLWAREIYVEHVWGDPAEKCVKKNLFEVLVRISKISMNRHFFNIFRNWLCIPAFIPAISLSWFSQIPWQEWPRAPFEQQSELPHLSQTPHRTNPPCCLRNLVFLHTHMLRTSGTSTLRAYKCYRPVG